MSEQRMKKVYAATSGSYSDYGIVAIFSTKEAAQLFMERHPNQWNDWNDIEEYDLDPGVLQMRKGYSHWMVQMEEDGSTISAEASGRYNLEAAPDKALRAESAGRRAVPVRLCRRGATGRCRMGRRDQRHGGAG